MSSKFRLRPKLCASSFALGLSLGSVSVQAQALVDPPENMVDPSFHTEQQCEARPRLYDVDQAAYWNLYRAVVARDHVSWADRKGYELDHIIPWCLCGSNDMSNLRAQPRAAADRRDGQERALCAKVRAKRTSLERARAQIYGWWRGGAE